MFSKPIFETLPIALIATGILLVTFIHHPASMVSGLALVLASCYMIYRRVNEIGVSSGDQDLSPTT